MTSQLFLLSRVNAYRSGCIVGIVGIRFYGMATFDHDVVKYSFLAANFQSLSTSSFW